MQELAGLPRAPQSWSWDNPQTATREFLQSNAEFRLEEPALPFNEGTIRDRVTYWPSAYLRRCA
jgi:hypothetical protein